MKRIAVLVLGALLLALNPHSPVFIEGDAGTPITVRAGETFFIALGSNPSTGYSWSETIEDPKILSYEGAVRQNPAQAMPGAPGQQIFIFNANRTGTSTILFAYSKSFDPNAPAGRTLSYTITVQ
jgi:inhibitor of cysteine peptidase